MAPAPRCVRGFSYIGLLILIALMGIGLAFAGEVWHATAQREKERELLFVGDQFRSAITSYYEGSPGGVKKFPDALEDLVEDRRYPTTKRHLRKIFYDPMTGDRQWGLVESPTGGIMGVYSLSEREPRKIDGFRVRDEAFIGAASYAEWKFGYVAAAAADSETGAAPVPGEGQGVPPGDGSSEEPSPPSPLPPAPPPTVPDKDDPNRKRICDNILRTDRASCALVRFNSGLDAGARCETSAIARNTACMNATPLPRLEIPIAD
jgi:type II secretory pathway pseudopilin PulG